MDHIHKYVPRTGTDKLLPILSVGDLLTVERELNAQEDMRNATTREKRKEGLIPTMADFHCFGNFLDVSCDTFCSLIK